jgi:catechol 2,3-dioxygenase-like lactoylglutathione lyase family enzyme
MSEIDSKLIWGHINVNVSNLERSLVFYGKLGFEMFVPAIPYLNLNNDKSPSIVQEGAARALGLAAGSTGRACIMQLGKGFPKLDLTEWSTPSDQLPLGNADIGIARICLATANLQVTYDQLIEQGVRFLSPPQATQDGKADIAVCVDPDGALIELIQLYLDKW